MLAGGEGERGPHSASEQTLLRPHHAPYGPAPRPGHAPWRLCHWLRDALVPPSPRPRGTNPASARPRLAPPAGCLKGARLGHKCFLLSRDFEAQAAAQARCVARGGSLAQPADSRQMETLTRYLRAALAPYNWPVWLGVHDRRAEGLYLFENGQRVSFFAWHRAPSPEPGPRPSAAPHPLSPNQPNGGVLENCVAQASDDGSWWDHDCDRRLYYVCEFPY